RFPERVAKTCHRNMIRRRFPTLLSYKPGEISPELALQIAEEFARENLSDYEVVMAVHTDKRHIHSHIVFNSVSLKGEKYHLGRGDYYRKIRAVSDRLCRKHGLSVISVEEEASKSVSYAEWLRQSRGQPTFRSMLEADLRDAIEDAASLGDFFMLMEHKGYEIKHGNRLSFRLRGQERFMCPGRKNPLFTEEGILAAIRGNMDAVEAGLKPVASPRPVFVPYRKHPKLTGFMALYTHYLYILGKIEKRTYPPRMTPKMRADVMKFEKLKAQFAFVRENNLTTREDMELYQSQAEEALNALMKRRTVLNVRKKKRRTLYAALADAEALREAAKLHENGVPGMEAECARYVDAVAILETCSIPKENLTREKAELYEEIAEVNREIREQRKKLEMCMEILSKTPEIEANLRRIEPKRRERRKTGITR
ncbi:MAG: relaxase/mobilization nuclease domain-containing protein, partial [Oscillibacter sp.]|nr:relaxase/mobilization nuclease domain-containing protein [Oscillibacter sp.]